MTLGWWVRIFDGPKVGGDILPERPLASFDHNRSSLEEQLAGLTRGRAERPDPG